VRNPAAGLIRLGAGLLALAAVMLGCATPVQDPPPGGQALQAAIRRGPVAAHPLFWRVEPRGGATLYLLGSIHFGPVEGWRMPKRVRRAFAKSETLVVEVDLIELALEQAMQGTDRDPAMLAPAGSSLADLVPEETLRELEAVASRHHIDASALMSLRPWSAALALHELAVAGLGFSQFESVEMIYLTRRGQREVISLESADDQLAPFAEMSAELELRMLQEALEDTDAVARSILAMADAWRRGDAASLAVMVAEGLGEDEAFADANEAVFGDRNRGMADGLAVIARDPRRRGTTAFVVIGAGHFVGPDSIRALLESDGFALEQLGP